MQRLFLLSVFFISFSSALQYHTLLLHDVDPDLPPPQTPSWADLRHSSDDIDNSLSLEVVHRDDHLHSDPSLNRHAIFGNRLLRDLHRVPSLATRASAGLNSSVFSGVPQGSGEYFTRLGIGTPPKYYNLILDTGSDISWIQCSPCQDCYKQSDLIFKPKKSTTYRPLPCESKRCMKLDERACDIENNLCQYQVAYGDGSFTAGDFSTETLTLRKNTVKRIAIGCGHDNEGLFVGAAGLLGLGGGKLSFPNQAKRLYGRKFSYCLVGRFSKNKSSILFGEASVSRKARFTAMLTNRHNPTFYYVSLIGISVGGERVRGIKPSDFKLKRDGTGGTMMDTGTVVTWLHESAYVALRSAFREAASELKLAPKFMILDTCFDLSGVKNVSVPAVVLHFDGKADMRLPVGNSLVEVDEHKRFCFAFAPTNGMSIIGNIQQQGFRITYDLKARRVGFTHNSC